MRLPNGLLNRIAISVAFTKNCWFACIDPSIAQSDVPMGTQACFGRRLARRRSQRGRRTKHRGNSCSETANRTPFETQVRILTLHACTITVGMCVYKYCEACCGPMDVRFHPVSASMQVRSHTILMTVWRPQPLSHCASERHGGEGGWGHGGGPTYMFGTISIPNPCPGRAHWHARASLRMAQAALLHTKNKHTMCTCMWSPKNTTTRRNANDCAAIELHRRDWSTSATLTRSS